MIIRFINWLVLQTFHFRNSVFQSKKDMEVIASNSNKSQQKNKRLKAVSNMFYEFADEHNGDGNKNHENTVLGLTNKSESVEINICQDSNRGYDTFNMVKKEHDGYSQMNNYEFESTLVRVECVNSDDGYIELAAENTNNDGAYCGDETYDSTLNCPTQVVTENVYNQFKENGSDLYAETLPSHKTVQLGNDYDDLDNYDEYNTFEWGQNLRSKNNLIYDNWQRLT